jgi:DUF4097 and DUF4098 domain-containing protein YvlB
MPPGGGAPPPNPPYDPRTQWRVYREQQKAAWRAQREAMKAQSHAWKHNYGAAYGPRVPSIVGPVILIAVGIVALLIYAGRISGGDFWTWYARWWPLLLIGAGLALLGEWAIDLRRETPVRRGGSFVGILILLAFLGVGAAGFNHMGPWFNNNWNWGNHDDDFFNTFGLPEHDMDQQVLNTAVGPNATVEIDNPRGDISITAGDGSNVEVQAHAVAYAGSDVEANKIFAAEKADISVSSNAVLIKSQGSNNGRINLTVAVPRSARLTINAGRGDMTAAGLGAGVTVTAPHGDVHLSAIAGNVQVHLSNDKHDFSAHQVDGDITVDGHCNDLTFSEVKGKIAVNGEIFGETHMENVSGPIHLHTSVTELEVASLPGDLTLNPDDLRVTEAKGQVRVTTHSKDVDLSQIYGESYVEDRDGRISVEPAGAFGVEAKNTKGDVEVTLPPNASAAVNARTHNGDIVSDFPMPSTEGENKTAAFQIGSGGSRVTLSADNGDVRIKRGSTMPPPPPATTSIAPPRAPVAPNAPHLKPPKQAPEPPVTQ